MSFQATSWVVEHSKHKGSSFVLLLMIANHAHADGTGAFPSLETLAREARITVRHVIGLIPKLVASGELRAEKHAGMHGTTLYSLPKMKPQISDSEKISRENGSQQSSPEQSLRTTKPEQKELIPDLEFEKFYEAYPRKVDKKTAYKAWKTMTVQDRQAAFAGIWKVQVPDLKFVPYPSRYLDARRWEDEPIPPPAVSATAGIGPVAVQSPPCWKCGRTKVWHALKPQNRKRDEPQDDGHQYEAGSPTVASKPLLVPG